MSNAGFPSNNVRSIACDSQGVVWAATDWGLCRYQGSTWTILQEGSSGLPENNLRALAVDADDRLWIGTTLYGLAILDGSVWTVYDVNNSPLPENEVNCITIDHRGWAWIGTTAGLACYTGTEWRVYHDGPTSYNGLILNANNIQSVAVGADGLVAVGTMNGGFHYLTDTLVMVNATYINSFPDNTGMGVVVDDAVQERWLATPANGLLRQGGSYVGGPWFQYAPWTSGIPSASLTCLVQDALGALWMGSTLSGLISRTAAGDFLNWNTGNSDLPDDHVRCVALAPDGAIWAGTVQGGAVRFAQNVGMAGLPGFEWSLEVHPNPVKDVLWCSMAGMDGTERWTWTVHDLQGRIHSTGYSLNDGPWPIHMDGAAAGPYLLSLLSKDGHRLFARVVKE